PVAAPTAASRTPPVERPASAIQQAPAAKRGSSVATVPTKLAPQKATAAKKKPHQHEDEMPATAPTSTSQPPPPTPADIEREIRQGEEREGLRRRMNDPPLTEIWSGKALNDLLANIKKLQGKSVKGPAVVLHQDMLKRINVISSKKGGANRLLKDVKEG